METNMKNLFEMCIKKPENLTQREIDYFNYMTALNAKKLMVDPEKAPKHFFKPLPFGVEPFSIELDENGIDPGILLRDIVREMKKKKGCPEEVDINKVWNGVLKIMESRKKNH